MAERPLLQLPRPERKPLVSRGFPVHDSVHPPGIESQIRRLDSKFGQISEIVSNPDLISEFQSDPAAIVPERALVFEVATSEQDLQRALERVPGLNFLGEDEDEIDEDEYFFTVNSNGERMEKPVPRRIFFTLPNVAALKKIEELWKIYKSEKRLTNPFSLWNKVFEHLFDVRSWGPQDRLSNAAKEQWENQLKNAPDQPIRLQAEFWYREDPAAREQAYYNLQKAVSRTETGGKIIRRFTMPEIRYNSALIEISPKSVQEIINEQDSGLSMLDDVMTLTTETTVRAPHDHDEENVGSIEPDDSSRYLGPPIAALIDGVPMAEHDWLKNRLILDDPDNFSDRYGAASEQQHGTSMASIILHGDLNNPTPQVRSPRRLYVRPITQPYPSIDGTEERTPVDESAIDLVRRAFSRMFGEDNPEGPAAPTVRIVNISLGDATRPFESVMSPWARLIDYLAWRYKVLIIVSAGNRLNSMQIASVENRIDLENMDENVRENVVIESILRHKMYRRLLAPSEGLNCLTVGASHSDMLDSRNVGMWIVDPYETSTLPNLSSAQGLGYRRSVKPEILMPGGREHIMVSPNDSPVRVTPFSKHSRLCGIGSAAPGNAGSQSEVKNFSGTSVATALATHGALHIYAALEDLQFRQQSSMPMEDYVDVLLKALLVHSARWDGDTSEKIKNISRSLGSRSWIHQRDDISRLLGFGLADIERVIDCTRERATLIGWNSINEKETNEFRIPIPTELENLRGFRSVTATAAWTTPLNTRKRAYRAAKLVIEAGSDRELSLGVRNSGHQPSHYVFGAGTVFHRRWEGGKAAPFVDGGDIVLNVSCTSPTKDLDESVRYGIAVSLEVGEDVDVPVYESVRQQVHQRVTNQIPG